MTLKDSVVELVRYLYDMLLAMCEGAPLFGRFVVSHEAFVERVMRSHLAATSLHAAVGRDVDGLRLQQQQTQFRFSDAAASDASRLIDIAGSVTLPRKKILVLDLDETLIHSTMQREQHDMQVTIFIEGQKCTLNVIKRPHVDRFLRMTSEWYHVIIFTASVQQYGDPVIDMLDTHGCIKSRYFRPNCKFRNGNFIKDLSVISDDLSQVIIIDNSPIAYSINQENAIPISNWFGGNARDEALLNLLPFLDALRWTHDVRSILKLRLGR